MTRWLPAVTAIVAIIACGTVHGIWTDRWTASEEPGASAARLNRATLSLADWDEQPVEETGKREDWIAGQMFRRYVQRRSGRAVTVFLVCGRAGPIAVHTPDVCYGASGFEVIAPSKYAGPAVPGLPDVEFKTAQFRRKRSTDPLQLRIYWSWSTGAGWTAPDDPRFTFARSPVLYKLYLIREITAKDDSLTEDPCVELMKQLLPELNRCLFAGG